MIIRHYGSRSICLSVVSFFWIYSAIQSILVGLQRQLSASSNAALNMPLLQLRVVLSNCPCCCLTEQLGSELVGTLLKLAPTIKTHSEENLERVLEGDPNRSEPLNTSPSVFEDSTNLIWRCVALLANKHIENSETEWAVISGVLERCTADDDEASMITKTQCNDTRKQSGTDTLKIVYLAKGLLLRGHRRCEEALSMALKNASQSIDGAKNFAIISRPEPKIFPREGHCAVRLLYPQRLLTFAVPRLIELFHNGNDAGGFGSISRTEWGRTMGFFFLLLPVHYTLRHILICCFNKSVYRRHEHSLYRDIYIFMVSVNVVLQ